MNGLYYDDDVETRGGDPLWNAAMQWEETLLRHAVDHPYNDDDDDGLESGTCSSTNLRQDPLYDDIMLHLPRTALPLPNEYSEFRLGQGDPLLMAAMKEWPVPKQQNRKTPVVGKLQKTEECTTLLDPSCVSWPFHDVVHLDNADLEEWKHMIIEAQNETRNDRIAIYSDEHTKEVLSRAERLSETVSNDGMLYPWQLDDFDSMHYRGHADLGAFMDAYMDLHGPNLPLRVLDVGAGLGSTSRFLAYQYPNIEVMAIDCLPAHVKAIRRLNQLCRGLDDRIQVQEGNILSLPAPTDRYDMLVSQLCFLHIACKEELWAACERVVKPHGIVYIEDFYWLGDSMQPRQADLDDLLEHQVSVPRGSLLTRSETENLLERHGFHVVEWRDRTREWSQFVYDRWQKFRKGLDHPNDDYLKRRSQGYIQSLNTFYGTMARVFHQFVERPNQVQVLMAAERKEVEDWKERPQSVGGMILVARRG